MSEVVSAVVVTAGITVLGVKTGIDPLALFAGLAGALWSLTTLPHIIWYVRPFAVFFAAVCSAWASTLLVAGASALWRKWVGSELDVLSAQPLAAAIFGYLFLMTLPKLQGVVDRGLAKAAKE